MQTPPRSRQRPSPSWVWTWSVISRSLVWVILASWAVGPVHAQAPSPNTVPRIVGTSADLDDLRVTVAWPDPVLETDLEMVLLDADHLVVAAQPLQALPGDRTQISFTHFFHRLPEMGPQFFATIRDANGSDISRRHAWRAALDCPDPAEPCRWATEDGLSTNALSLSQPLRWVLDTLEAERSSDLLADVLEQRPDLRGAVFSLAAQLDLLDQHLDLGNDCFCVWSHSSFHWPHRRRCGYQGPGKQLDGTGSEQEAHRGPGAMALAAAQGRKASSSMVPNATALSQQTMELNCLKVQSWLEEVDLPLEPRPERPTPTIRFPVLEPCEDTCRGTVETSVDVLYYLSTGMLQSPPESALAVATVYGSVERDTDVQATQVTPWDDFLQWTPGSTLKSRLDIFNLPTDGVFVDTDTRLVTATLRGTAMVVVEAEDTKAWAFGKAAFLGGSLQMQGEAECALLPTGDAELETWNDEPETEDCGEPQIEPWED